MCLWRSIVLQSLYSRETKFGDSDQSVTLNKKESFMVDTYTPCKRHTYTVLNSLQRFFSPDIITANGAGHVLGRGGPYTRLSGSKTQGIDAHFKEFNFATCLQFASRRNLRGTTRYLASVSLCLLRPKANDWRFH